MLRYSNNYIADVLTLKLCKEKQRIAFVSVKLCSAAKILRNSYWVVFDKVAFSQDSITDFSIFNSASSLTLPNRIFADNLISLLKAIYQDKRDFPVFYVSLVIPA